MVDRGTSSHTNDIAYDAFSSHDPARLALEHITGRWGMPTLGALARGPVRFNALVRRIDGVSRKMLARTLQALERDGFVRRDVQTATALHVEYSLTPLGFEVAAKALELIGLLQRHMSDVLAAHRRADGVAPSSDTVEIWVTSRFLLDA
ncbi:helix-turn-helix domain-containing protein [Actinocrispum sp. NPDC049592]|uniref:winged helix-turn-helix transcriptional regulator n=1 Tax=Actinocrispum sp. NPDC049592 TaxID=3154835 RepID=UPI00342461EF